MASSFGVRSLCLLGLAGLSLGLASCDAAKPPAPPPPKPVALAPPAALPTPPALQAPAKPAPHNSADAELAARVKAKLAATPGLQSFTMDVTASDGVVSLFGTAPNKATRDKAASAAAKVEGVKFVKNNLVIVAGS